MKKLAHRISFLFFFGLIIIIPLLTCVLPKQETSELENKFLKKFPTFSVDNVFSRKYMKDIEEYISDHFLGRTTWIAARTDMELLTGKADINGVYVLQDRLVEKLTTPNNEIVDKSIAAINNFAATNNVPVYVMVAPTATGIYRGELPAYAPQYDQRKFIESIYGKLSKGVFALDAYSPLFVNKNEYIYYRNDHHWTSLGAYLAYAGTIKKMGFQPIPQSAFDIEHASNDFRGTLYSKILYDGAAADTIDLYHNPKGIQITGVEVNTGKGIEKYDSMYFREFLDKKDKYSVFCGTNQPIVTIKTDAPKENKLLIFKDSYAHSYVQFLAQHYSEITMVDMRYINVGYKAVVDPADYNQVLFLYNGSSFATDENIKKLDIK